MITAAAIVAIPPSSSLCITVEIYVFAPGLSPVSKLSISSARVQFAVGV